MASIETATFGDGSWDDLLALRDKGRLIDLSGPKAPPLRVVGVPQGTREGRGSVLIRLDLPDGRVLITETTMRAWWSATTTLAARVGEDFMRPPSPGEQTERLELALQDLTKQLFALQDLYKLPHKLDFTWADAEWDRRHPPKPKESTEGKARG